MDSFDSLKSQHVGSMTNDELYELTEKLRSIYYKMNTDKNDIEKNMIEVVSKLNLCTIECQRRGLPPR